MTELEKLKAGLEYCYDDPEVDALKQQAIVRCKEYNAIDDTDYEARYACLQRMLGAVGEKVWIGKTFNCDNGRNIFIGNNFNQAAGGRHTGALKEPRQSLMES